MLAAGLHPLPGIVLGFQTGEPSQQEKLQKTPATIAVIFSGKSDIGRAPIASVRSQRRCDDGDRLMVIREGERVRLIPIW